MSVEVKITTETREIWKERQSNHYRAWPGTTTAIRKQDWVFWCMRASSSSSQVCFLKSILALSCAIPGNGEVPGDIRARVIMECSVYRNTPSQSEAKGALNGSRSEEYFQVRTKLCCMLRLSTHTEVPFRVAHVANQIPTQSQTIMKKLALSGGMRPPGHTRRASNLSSEESSAQSATIFREIYSGESSIAIPMSSSVPKPTLRPVRSTTETMT